MRCACSGKTRATLVQAVCVRSHLRKPLDLGQHLADVLCLPLIPPQVVQLIVRVDDQAVYVVSARSKQRTCIWGLPGASRNGVVPARNQKHVELACQAQAMPITAALL